MSVSLSSHTINLRSRYLYNPSVLLRRVSISKEHEHMALREHLTPKQDAFAMAYVETGNASGITRVRGQERSRLVHLSRCY